MCDSKMRRSHRHLSCLATLIIPIHTVKIGCDDPRHPAFHDGWISSCDATGAVAQLIQLDDQRAVDLSAQKGSIVSTQFWWSGLDGGLSVGGEKDSRHRLTEHVQAPAANSERWVVGLGEGELWIKDIEAQTLLRVAAQPKLWHAPAISGSHIAWVNDDGKGGADIWAWSAEEGPYAIATGPQWQQGVVAFNGHWAWIEDHHVVIHNIHSQEEARIPAHVVDGLTAYEGGVCWSAFGERDLDIFCSDGLSLVREGHQRWPYRSDNVVIFREAQKVMQWTISPTQQP